MIDPTAITDFDRTPHQLEELLLNAITFAGKNARQQALKMHTLFARSAEGPFASIRTWNETGVLGEKLRHVKIGKYALLEKSFSMLAHASIDLTRCSVEELERFPGIGAKTARLFILHSRRDQKYAVIDTHMLKEMRALKLTTLRTPPSGKRYLDLERSLIEHLEKSGVRDFADYDLSVWKKYSVHKQRRVQA